MIVDSVREYYVGRWGNPSRKAKFHVKDFAVEVYKWDKDANSEGVTMYVTLGASAFAMPGMNTLNRYEFIMGLLPARDDVVSAFAGLALYHAREGVAVAHGHTVSSETPLWQGTKMRAFLVLRQVRPILGTLRLADGVSVEFLQAVPIFEAEREYKNQHGTEMLLDKWEKAQVPFWHTDREVGV
ncbi:MAG: hypothetical protein NVS9B2_27750 [Steroidobacteraceae bacterium]